MGTERKLDLDRRLEAYFATLRSSAIKKALKRGVGNWQMYAAVSGSAMAMATGASASLIGSAVQFTREPTASARLVKQPPASSKGPPIINGGWLVVGRRGQGFINAAPAAMAGANQTQAPSIVPPGVVPIYGTKNIIEPGEWVSVFGQNLASETATWNGDFPTSLGGTSVTVDGKSAYLSYVSPTQINIQAPDDMARGTVSVVVTTAAGSATSAVTLSEFAPSFCLFYQKFVAGVIVRSDGSGAYGGGTYDLLGPTGNSFGYYTVAAQPGDIIELYAVGFGPTTPTVPAGKAFSGAAPLNNPISLYINNSSVEPMWAGISEAGLVQINLTVPDGLGGGAVSIQANVGGMQTQPGVLFSLATSSVGGTTGGTGGGGGVGTGGGGGVGTGGGGGVGTGGPGTGFGGGSGGGTGGGTGGGNGGGTGGGNGGGTGGGNGGGSGGGTGGGSAALPTKPYQPRLRFGPMAEDVEG